MVGEYACTVYTWSASSGLLKAMPHQAHGLSAELGNKIPNKNNTDLLRDPSTLDFISKIFPEVVGLPSIEYKYEGMSMLFSFKVF